MKISIKNALVASAFALCTVSAYANDCGWADLKAEEQDSLSKGQPVMHLDFSQGNAVFKIDQWAFTGNSSLFDSTANFFDIGSFEDPGNIVDSISLTEGEKASNNPVRYDVNPKSTNPFGQLYQPFTFSASVQPVADTYVVKIDYLTSPGIVKDVYNEVCLAKVNGKVLVRFLSTAEGNPKIGLDFPHFGVRERAGLWQAIFAKDMKRASRATTEDLRTNLKKALLGNSEQ